MYFFLRILRFRYEYSQQPQQHYICIENANNSINADHNNHKEKDKSEENKRRKTMINHEKKVSGIVVWNVLQVSSGKHKDRRTDEALEETKTERRRACKDVYPSVYLSFGG